MLSSMQRRLAIVLGVCFVLLFGLYLATPHDITSMLFPRVPLFVSNAARDSGPTPNKFAGALAENEDLQGNQIRGK